MCYILTLMCDKPHKTSISAQHAREYMKFTKFLLMLSNYVIEKEKSQSVSFNYSPLSLSLVSGTKTFAFVT